MSQPELLSKVVRTLDELEIPYMMTGSIVASLQGEPRATHDIDLVFQIHEHHVNKLARRFPLPHYDLDRGHMREAITEGGLFHLFVVRTRDKVDFWLLTNDPFDQSRFSRRIAIQANGETIYVSTPEDTILKKLEWGKRVAGYEKQFADCLRIYELQHDRLDMAYLDAWAARLNITDVLARIRQLACPVR